MRLVRCNRQQEWLRAYCLHLRGKRVAIRIANLVRARLRFNLNHLIAGREDGNAPLAVDLKLAFTYRRCYGYSCFVQPSAWREQKLILFRLRARGDYVLA